MTEHRFILGDAAQELGTLPDNLVHGTFTSPPYFGKLDYGVPDQLGLETLEMYICSMAEVFREVYRVTLPGGALLLNIGNTWNNNSPVRSRLSESKQDWVPGTRRRSLAYGYREKAELPIAALLSKHLGHDGWLHRDTWVWSKGLGRPTHSDRPCQSHEYVGYFRKPDCPGRYRELHWDGRFIAGTVHYYRPTSDPSHPCPFPLDMAKDYVQAIVPEHGTVLDPFAGIGTVAQAAKETGRNSVSIDLKDWSNPDG